MRVPRDAHAGPTPACKVSLDAVQVDEALGRSNRVENGDRTSDKVLVTVFLEPIERRARGARAIQARCAHHDDLVGRVENPARGRFENARAGVETDEVVVVFEKSNRSLKLSFTDRLRDA